MTEMYDPSPYTVWRAIADTDQFEVLPEHLALLGRARSAWEGHRETGAPGLDHRRPFGGDDPYEDMAAILGDNDEDRHARLFGELGLVLEIVLQAQQFKPGLYIRAADGWRLAG
ncbi:hypothetical protein [Acrocarpospora catenulata]|uniref:hypothetical protein n=1 Tax=Acrocarpospora catenulata TaxID=2836182 RepID=UPI001BD9D5C9|nr:hypothetical protein [Acrocarpospora catenulata]